MALHHEKVFEILLDQSTVNAFGGGLVAWCEDYTCTGIDATIFPRGQLPMKRVLLDVNKEIVDRFPVAALFYAMALRRGNVVGLPVGVMRVTITAEGQLHAFLGGALLSNPREHGVAFTKILDKENYPGLEDTVFHPLAVDVAREVLEYGQALLAKEIVVSGVNDETGAD
jgi:hypothetical protein